MLCWGGGSGRTSALARAVSKSAIGSDAVAGESRPRGGDAPKGCFAEDYVHISDQWDRELSARAGRRLRRTRHSEFGRQLSDDALGHVGGDGGSEGRRKGHRQRENGPGCARDDRRGAGKDFHGQRDEDWWA